MEYGSIRWSEVKRLKIPVIDYGSCFITNDNRVIDWSSYDAIEAQSYLQKVSQEPPKEFIMTPEVMTVLSNCIVEGHIVKLPTEQLDRKTYEGVKKKLELIGGKWKGGKTKGFVFIEDPQELLNQVASGEDRNLKKEFQFFATPDALANRLVAMADIMIGHEILEPSAGQGAIVKAIQGHLFVEHEVSGYELMPVNQTFLSKITGFKLLGNDFLAECNNAFDRIIANPPFSKNQDIDHIMKMYDCLKEDGRIVSIASNHWRQSGNKKETAFRAFLESIGAQVHDIEAGAFKESGTSISACIVVIDK